MENAADALRMAAGVLIAILLISLIIFMFRNISQNENTRRDQEQIKEISEFNTKFLAYEKSSMYGTDVISILGMAISNNQICNQEKTSNPDGRYDQDLANSINIKFTLKSNVQSKESYFKYNTMAHKVDDRWEGAWEPDTSKQDKMATIFIANKEYSLLYKQNEYESIHKIAIEGNQNVSETIVGRKMTRTDNSGFNDFKKRIFECTDVHYNPVGRIDCMTFVEKNTQ